MEAKYIASLFQLTGLHPYPSGSAGTFAIADGGNQRLEWNPSVALLLYTRWRWTETSATTDWAGVSGELMPDCTCSCHFRGCNTTEISLNKQHMRNLKVLPTEGQNNTGIFAIVHEINQEQSYCKRLCLIRWQASGGKAWTAQALQQRLSGTSSIFFTAFVTDHTSWLTLKQKHHIKKIICHQQWL